MIRTTGLVLAVLAALTAWLVATAPVDAIQGIVQKILYSLAPCGWAALVGFWVRGGGGGLYRARGEERWDRLAIAGAEVGGLFCALNIATGPIWAKATWGHWWVWDPRLTVTLLLWFIYLAYLLLRSFTEGSERTARFAAVYGLVGLLAIPLNYYAIELAGGATLHPENLERDSLGAGMRLPFLLSVLTGIAAFAHLLALRFDLENRRAELPEPGLMTQSGN